MTFRPIDDDRIRFIRLLLLISLLMIVITTIVEVFLFICMYN